MKMTFKILTRITAIAAVAGIFATTACEPLSESEQRYFEAREFDADQQRELMQTVAEWNSVDGAVELVKATDAPDDEEGSTEDWIERKRAEIRGDVMFPRWEGRRLGSHNFEVRYTHTVIDYDYNIEKSGFTWEVDTMLKMVNGPTPIDPAELEPRPRREPPRLELE